MKLNKVLALALSGVMAVSMLAGCSNNSGNGGQNGEGDVIVTPSTGAAAILNDEQDKIEFTNVNSSELQSAATGLLATDLSTSSVATAATNANTIYKRLEALKVENLKGGWSDLGDNHDKNETKTVTLVYQMSGAYSMDELVEQIAKQIKADDTNIRGKAVVSTGENKIYNYSYTGTVSTVNATSIDGVQSANYVLLTVTESVTVEDAII